MSFRLMLLDTNKYWLIFLFGLRASEVFLRRKIFTHPILSSNINGINRLLLLESRLRRLDDHN